MTYYAICCLFNTTTLTADSSNLTIKVGPVPFFGNRKVAKEDIIQLFFVEKLTKSSNSGSAGRSYQLKMVDKNNKTVRLVKSLSSPDQARFMETKLEKYFKIKNVPVAGEYDR